MAGLREHARSAGVPLLVQGLGPVFNTAFLPRAAGAPDGWPSGAPPGGVSDYRAYAGLDAARQRAFLRALQDGGVRVTARGTWFLSTAHSEADVEETLRVAGRALRAV